MKETQFEAQFINIETNKHPLVRAAFMDADGKIRIGVMLIDTGASCCILNRSIVPMLSPGAVRYGDKLDIRTIHPADDECQGVDFTFKMGNQVFTQVFYVNDNVDFDKITGELIGIIGYRFLIEHALVLDYGTQSLHASRGFDGNLEACEFFFPMEYGITNYEIPVVGATVGDAEFIMIADSGCQDTVITKHTLARAGLSGKPPVRTETVSGFDNRPIACSVYRVNLNLLTIAREGDTQLREYSDEVRVISTARHIMDNYKDDNGNDMPPISGLLSSSFMLSHKWVLDFALCYIYSRPA